MGGSSPRTSPSTGSVRSRTSSYNVLPMPLIGGGIQEKMIRTNSTIQYRNRSTQMISTIVLTGDPSGRDQS
jgi:hypothetical protein